ncbi:deoxyuridine triphosphatase [Beluga whale alphaherpesvirus 1]|uniref:Deoxyuridine triphosphatase n=1 Tax=Beluga whale alphaherpesvirus 1 TaxID=1434720 RepID=A0A286RUI4_9ALPH|nr:deoxyuridine triphosphatase [Beluga whale alphaherpesvirus 1]ASW27055.1 deoxyuridine triphosphatase [Beluga whale alphaherpesvirus 1]
MMLSRTTSAEGPAAGPGPITILLEPQRGPWATQPREDGSLVMQNREPLTLCAPVAGAALYTQMLDLQLRVAVPSGYATLLTRTALTANEEAAADGVFISAGVIDSGYRGSVKGVVWFEAQHQPVPARALALRLTVIRLADAPPRLYRGPKIADLARAPRFQDFFARRRDEDAGYDVFAPTEIRIEAYAVATVRLPVTHRETSSFLYVFGRSSLNRGGLLVRPRRWEPGEVCQFHIRNLTAVPTLLRAAQRVAQLIVTTHAIPWVSGSVGANVFPLSSPAPADPPIATRWTLTEDFDRDAPASDRAAAGFGSTGV